MEDFLTILNSLNAVRSKQFASEPERQEVLADATQIAVIRLLERLSKIEAVQSARLTN